MRIVLLILMTQAFASAAHAQVRPAPVTRDSILTAALEELAPEWLFTRARYLEPQMGTPSDSAERHSDEWLQAAQQRFRFTGVCAQRGGESCQTSGEANFYSLGPVTLDTLGLAHVRASYLVQYRPNGASQSFAAAEFPLILQQDGSGAWSVLCRGRAIRDHGTIRR